MNKFIASIFILSFYTLGVAQEKIYFDKNHQKTDKENASYFSISIEEFDENNNPVEKRQLFYMDSTLKEEFYIINNNRNGKFSSYYQNSNIESIGNYSDGLRSGVWEYWYPNKNKKMQMEYQTDLKAFFISNDPSDIFHKMINFWDSTGNQLVTNGNGLFYNVHENGKIEKKGNYKDCLKEGKWEGWYDDGKAYFQENYSEGKLTEGQSFDKEGQKREYTVIGSQPEPVGGLASFYKYVSDSLVYPKYARRKGIEGKVFTQFVVDKDGSLIDIKILRGIGSGCDEEVIRLLKEVPKWTPGYHRGIPIKVRMMMPIVFKLK